ncbi:MAG TPA: TIGR03545 family protein [Nitrospirales bacterium]|nr:TIGR03545 family protein [Nitrospirales bacterium]
MADTVPPKKQGWIRWSGVIAFAAVVAVIAAVWFLLVDSMVKRTIEKTGTAIVGAKVELDKADLSLFPLGLTLSRLQVTSPERPMVNAVEVSRIALTLEPLNLLRRKVIVEEMTMDGVQFETARKHSGAVAPAPEEKSLISSIPLPSFTMPNVKDLIEKEDLESLKLAQTAKAEVDVERQRWEQRMKALPDKAKLESYRKRIESLKGAGKGGLGGILGGASDVLRLQQEISADVGTLTTAKKDLEQSVALAKQRVEQATKAPLRDVEKLKAKYAPGAAGASNITRLLFGDRMAVWVETGFRWRDRLEPVVSRVTDKKGEAEVVKPVRGKGVDVRYKEYAPLPDFLIRTAHGSVTVPAGIMTARIENITPDQPILGKPLTFTLAGDKLKGLSSVKVDGALNRVHPAESKDTVNAAIRGAEVDALPLVKTSDLAVALDHARVDVDVNASIVGHDVKAALDAKTSQVTLGGQGNPNNPVAKIISDALHDIKGFDLKAAVTGTRDQYDVSVSSNLDQAVADALGRQFHEQAAKLEAQLQAAINDKVAGSLEDLKRSAGGFDGLIAEVTGRLNLGNDLLKNAAGGKRGLKLPF